MIFSFKHIYQTIQGLNMSLEDAINNLAIEIKALSKLLESNNDRLNKLLTDQPIKIKKLLNEEDTAKYIGVSRSYLAKDRMNGLRKGKTHGPNPIRLGNKVMYDVEDLNKWIEDNKNIRTMPW